MKKINKQSYFIWVAIIILAWFGSNIRYGYHISKEDFKNINQFCLDLYQLGKEEVISPHMRLWQLLDMQSRMTVFQIRYVNPVEEDEIDKLVENVNYILKNTRFFDSTYFPLIRRDLLNKLHRPIINTNENIKLNYQLFAEAFDNYLHPIGEKYYLNLSSQGITPFVIQWLMPLIIMIIAFEYTRKQARDFSKTTKYLEEMRNLLGLEQYIERAAKIYKEKAERVVTSLLHWVSSGSMSNDIIEGLKKSKAEKIIFIGKIDINSYFPGVLWRFLIAKKYLKGRGLILHTSEEIPLFVVSKKQESKHNIYDHGSLLIGNLTRSDIKGKTYGVYIGKADPKLVDYYNYIFDTVIYPNSILEPNGPIKKDEIEKIYKATSIKVDQITDGLKRIFQLDIFKNEGIVFQEYQCEGIEKKQIEEELCIKISNMIFTFLKTTQKFDSEYSESYFKNESEKIIKIIYEFIKELINSNILSIKRISKMRYSLELNHKYTNNHLPNCGDLFVA